MITPSTARPLLVAAVLLLASAATTSAFNITILLSRYPGFEQFNQLLTTTNLARDINSRRTITVLGLPNDRLSQLMQMTPDVQKSILSLHVILDYYDMMKLNKLAPGSKTLATTLYQSSGVADGQQGFINIVHLRDGTFVFGSAMPNSPLVSTLVNSVAAQPFNISVLSVSQPIIAPGLDGSWATPTVPSPPTAPAPAPMAKAAPPPAAEEPAVEEPAAEVSAPAPSPSKSKSNRTRTASPAPAPAPAGEDSAAGEDSPAADEAEGEADAGAEEAENKKSAAAEGVVSGVTVGVVIGLASFLAWH